MFSIDLNINHRPLHDLRPTQLTVGMRKVAEKRRQLKTVPAKKRQTHMAAQLYPAVKGPGDAFYILDHHHEAMAALQENAEIVSVGLVCDLSHLSKDAFWIYLDHRSWVHCYDQHGHRRFFGDVPKRFEDMVDDPYRSLSASVEEAGGFAKPDQPFFEFLWANHFRSHIAAANLRKDYKHAVDEAVRLARSKKSQFLPGWAGKSGK
jgi:hypothetical protein